MALMAKLGPGKLDSHEVNNVYNISCCAILMLVSHVLQSLKNTFIISTTYFGDSHSIVSALNSCNDNLLQQFSFYFPNMRI